MSQPIPRLCPKCKKRVIDVPCPNCEAMRKAQVNKQRRPSDKAFYDSAEWEIIRTQQLAKHMFCQFIREDGLECKKIAKHVDHIVAREKGGTNDPSNLRSGCVSCHSRKTVQEDGGFGRKKNATQ